MVQAAKPISLSLCATVLALLTVRETFLAMAIIGTVLVLLMILNPVIRKTD
jgi:hypothetical protein